MQTVANARGVTLDDGRGRSPGDGTPS